jgi:hypothetical protein
VAFIVGISFKAEISARLPRWGPTIYHFTPPEGRAIWHGGCAAQISGEACATQRDGTPRKSLTKFRFARIRKSTESL